MKSFLFFLSILLSIVGLGQGQLNSEFLKHGTLITVIDSCFRYRWIGTQNGLYRVNKKTNKCKFYSLSNNGYASSLVTSLLCLEDGCVWIGTNNGLLKYDNYAIIPYTTENCNLPENVILDLKAGCGSDLLVKTLHYGTFRMHKNRFHRLEPFEAPRSDEKVLAER